MQKVKRFTNATLELRAGDGDLPDISGVGAPFYRADEPGTTYDLWDGVAERIMPGAFDDLQSDPAASEVYATYNHNDMQVLGRVSAGTLSLMVDNVGLRYKVKASSTTFYRDLVTSMQRGDVKGSSFTFIPLRDKWIEGEDDEPDVRELELVRLFEVGPVVNPAYTASTSSIREADQHEAQQSYENWRNEKRADGLADAMKKAKGTLDRLGMRSTLYKYY